MIPLIIYVLIFVAAFFIVTRIQGAGAKDYTSLKTVTFGDESAVRPNRAAGIISVLTLFVIWGMFTGSALLPRFLHAPAPFVGNLEFTYTAETEDGTRDDATVTVTVHPREEETEAHGDFDRTRDALVLPLIRACVERGQPVFGVCRGFQEMNVAMGGTLHPEIRDLPGRMNHRMPPDGTLEEKFEIRHKVNLSEGGVFHEIFGAKDVMTNTLHGQGIKQAGARIVIDGTAEDGTPEAIYVKDAPGFTASVQWHPEWNAQDDPVSRPLFAAFGKAAHSFAQNRGLRQLKSA